VVIYEIFMLLAFAGLAFVQNMAFTWVSRSRNSGDANYHRYAAWCSNGIWLLTNGVIFSYLSRAIASGDFTWLLVAGVVYIVATTEGSVLMMKLLLKTETGKRKVGAS
jgi:hypothetical protein